MRKPLASRIFGLAFLYCAVFFILVIMQFSGSGNFTLPAGLMTVRGRYMQAANYIPEPGGRPLAGGIKIFFGGLEFNLKEDKEKGLTLTDADGAVTPVNPEFMIVMEDAVRFGLPGGSALVFHSFDSARGSELQISAEFAEDISEAAISIIPRRSSIVRDNGQIGILYNGGRYLFGASGHELETGRMVLSRENAHISYRARGQQKIFDPADYIIPQAQNYTSALANWQESSYAYWSQNAAALQYEDDVTAYCAEALQRGSYAAAVASIPGSFLSSSRHSFRSSGFLGGMTGTFREFTTEERERLNLITQLTREGSLDILKENHVLDFLFVRSNTTLANDVINLVSGAAGDQIIPEYCPGLLEFYFDLKQWRPAANNPVDSLSEQILLLVSEILNRDANKDLVYASHTEVMDLEFSLRLGKALAYWAEDAGNTEWAAIGRSLVLSALTAGGAGSGKLYRILSPVNYYPRASLLSDNSLWAWTVSPSVRATYIDSNLNIALSFPANSAHYIMFRNVRPFIRIQLHETDWRTDSQFERYDSSGWVYFPQEQILIVKLRHRTAVENIRIIYRVEQPPPVIQDSSETEEAAGGNVAS